MNESLIKGQLILKSQPFSCFLGAELNNLSEGFAEISLHVRSEFEQNNGFIHGGVLSYLADNCLAFSAATILGGCVTSEYKINYLRPALGKLLIARAVVVSSGKRQAVCECRVLSIEDEKEKLVVIAVGTLVKIEE